MPWQQIRKEDTLWKTARNSGNRYIVLALASGMVKQRQMEQEEYDAGRDNGRLSKMAKEF